MKITIKNTMEELIKTFARHGVKITKRDIPVILREGVDTFLSKRNYTIREKYLDELHVIVHSLREQP